MSEGVFDWVGLFAPAAIFYAVCVFLSTHLSESVKKRTTSWLNGEFQENWIDIFCNTFDNYFGKKVLSKKRALAIFLFSFLSSGISFVLLVRVGAISPGRLYGDANLGQVLLFALVLNTVPVFVTSLQTRFLLGSLRRIRRFFGQVFVLLVDAGLSIAISLTWIIAASRFMPVDWGNHPVTLIGIFSPYSIFFISSIFMSIWTVGYFLTFYFVALFKRFSLNSWLEISDKPFHQIGLAGSAVILVFSVIGEELAETDDGRLVSRFDRIVCSFSEIGCFEAARSQDNAALAAEFLEIACGDEQDTGSTCVQRLEPLFNHDTNLAVQIWKKACDRGYPRACRVAANAYYQGYGLEKDKQSAFQTAEFACEQGDGIACFNLSGMLREAGDGNRDRASELLEKACALNTTPACINIAQAILNSPERTQVETERGEHLLIEQCKKDQAACVFLAWHYIGGRIDGKTSADALPMVEKVCQNARDLECIGRSRLSSWRSGLSQGDIPMSIRQREYYCSGLAEACYLIARVYEDEKSEPFDLNIATSTSREACTMGYHGACRLAAFLLQHVNYPAALQSLLDGCQLGNPQMCHDFISAMGGVETEPLYLGEIKEFACSLELSEVCKTD